MIKLTRLWKNKSVSTITKLRLMRAFVWPVATHGCEAWTLRKQEEKCIQAFENKCVRKLLRIPWTKLMTTAQVYRLSWYRKSRDPFNSALLASITSLLIQFPSVCQSPIVLNFSSRQWDFCGFCDQFRLWSVECGVSCRVVCRSIVLLQWSAVLAVQWRAHACTAWISAANSSALVCMFAQPTVVISSW